MMRTGFHRLRQRGASVFILRALLLLMLFGFWGLHTAYAGVTVTPTTWNVIGLDSNDQTSGPDTFQIGARACNTGSAAVTNLTANFIWDSVNAYVELSGNPT